MKNTTLKIMASGLFAAVLAFAGFGAHAVSAQTTYGSSCVINSFNASPTTIVSGESATLYWTTSGCSTVTLSGGSLYGSYAPLTGSMSTGPINGTTLFTLSANGMSGATSASTTISATNSQYPYSYTCAYGSTDPSCSSAYAGKFITAPATNIGATSTRLNGLVLNTLDTFSVYFEYGTDPSNLNHATYFQSLGDVTTFAVTQDLKTTPNTTYYYRLVAQISGGPTIRGDILSFTTLGADSVSYVADTTTGSGTSTSGSNTATGSTTTTATTPTASGIQVTVTNQGDKVAVGDIAEYTVTYTNGTAKTLKDAVLTIVMPQGFVLKQTTQGTMLNSSTVSLTLGTLAPQQTGSVYVQATVGPNTMLGTTLVTNATLNYTLPNGTHDSAVGYVLNHATASGQFAGFALGTGFFPSTIFGWFITIIIILVIILIARRITKEKEAAKHGGHGHGHGTGGHH